MLAKQANLRCDTAVMTAHYNQCQHSKQHSSHTSFLHGCERAKPHTSHDSTCEPQVVSKRAGLSPHAPGGMLCSVTRKTTNKGSDTASPQIGYSSSVYKRTARQPSRTNRPTVKPSVLTSWSTQAPSNRQQQPHFCHIPITNARAASVAGKKTVAPQ